MGCFEIKRNLFLSALLSKDWITAKDVYQVIADKVDSSSCLSEVDQKAVNQIQHAFKKIGGQIPGIYSRDMSCFNRHIRKKMAAVVRNKIHNPLHVEFNQWYEALGLEEYSFDVMLGTVTNLQMTSGCNNFCRRCNEWALPGARKHFSFNAVKNLLTRLFETGNSDFLLYGASDPLDWQCDGRTTVDIIRFLREKGCKTTYGMLTKMPRGTESVFVELLDMDADIGVSVTKKNRDKIKKIQQKTGKQIDFQHDVDDLIILSGFDEDFSSIKSSITDNYGTEITPEGAFLIIPAFTSALNLTGQHKIPVTENTGFFLKKRVGFSALTVEYFKPLAVINLKGEEFILNRLLDAQIQNIMLDNGSEDISPPGMMNFREYLKTYERNAVLRRKTLFLSVLKKLRKNILQGSMKQEDFRLKRYDLFRQKVDSYLARCDISRVLYYKKNIFSYYLKAISVYLKVHAAERQIVLHLRKEDISFYEKKYGKIVSSRVNDIDAFIDTSEMGMFDQFQVMMFILLYDPDNNKIKEFIHKHPSCYVPGIDSFEQVSS